MKASFPGINAWLWTILTIIVVAMAIYWATGQFDNMELSKETGSADLKTDTVVYSEAYPQVSQSQMVRYLHDYGGEQLKDKGLAFYRLGVQYNTDPAFAVAVSRKETSLGKSTCQQISKDCNNFFCIKDTTGSSPCGIWASYDTPEDSIEAFYRLIEYYKERGQDTISEIACGPGSGFSHSSGDYCYCEEGGSFCSTWVSGTSSVPAFTAEIRDYLTA